MVLGIEDGWVSAAYILCVLSSLLCIVYGAMNWNKGAEAQGDEDRHWAETEDKVDEEL